MLTEYNKSISFNAKLGPNLRSYLLANEFAANTAKIDKFEKFFSDTFAKSLDDNTVLDRKNNGKFEIFHSAFNSIKIPVKIYERKGLTLSQNLLNESRIAYGRAEYVLFQRYIASQVKEGRTLEQIQAVGERRLGAKRKPYFMDLIETAKRILAEDSKSELNEYDFSKMINIQLREVIDTPEFQALMAKTKK